MKKKFSCIAPALFLFLFAVGIVPASSAQPTVLGPEFKLTKAEVHSLQKDERRCDYFLWTKLGGDVQRISFNYLVPGAKPDSDAPRVENVTVVLNEAKTVPTARMIGTDDNYRTLWQLEMSHDTYDSNQQCLRGIPVSAGPSK